MTGRIFKKIVFCFVIFAIVGGAVYPEMAFGREDTYAPINSTPTESEVIRTQRKNTIDQNIKTIQSVIVTLEQTLVKIREGTSTSDEEETVANIASLKDQLESSANERRLLHIQELENIASNFRNRPGELAARAVADATAEIKKVQGQTGMEFLRERDALTTEIEENAAKARADEARSKGEEEVKITCPGAGLTLGNLGETVTCLIAKGLYSYILTFANYLLSLVSSFFNSIMELAISNMGETLGLCRTAGEKCVDVENNVIDIGWILFRDITNLLLIFVLVYAAIRTILGGLADTGRTIVAVIAVGVLINFSMFFTKVIVDISNTLSTSFYNSIITFNENQWKKVQEEGGIANMPPFDEKDVIGPMVAKSNVVSIVGQVKEANDTANSPLSYTMIIKQSLIGTAFIVVLIGIILIMSLMLLARVLILGFIIMTSAIAVGSFILPEFKKAVFDKWFPALLGQAFFAPVFLMFLYVSLRFMTEFKNTGSITDTASLANLASSSGIASATQGTIQFVLVIGMLIISLKIAQSMASKAGGASGKITGFLGGAALGMASFATRGVLGGGGGALLNAMAGDRDTKTARILRAGGEKLSTSSFDIRNSKKFESFSKAVGGVELGKGGGEGGYDKWRESTVLNAISPTEKNLKKQIEEQEKGYKEVGKYTKEEQASINAMGVFKNNKIDGKKNTMAVEVKELQDRRDALEKLQNDAIAAGDQDKETAIKKRMNNVDKELAKRDMTPDEAEAHLKSKGYSAIKGAEKDAIKAAEERKKAYVDSRRSKAGEEFRDQQNIKDAKEKNPNDEIIGALGGLGKSISSKP